MRKKFEVSGMMCAACQSNVTKMVQSLDGVESVNVSLLAKSMIVDFDPARVDENRIRQTVEKGGYGCALFVNESVQAMQRKKEAELRKKRNRLLWSWLAMAALMVFAMLPMFLGDSFMQREDYIPLMIGDIALQLLLVLPILILHFDLVSSGIKALFRGMPNMQSLVASGMIASLAYGLYSFIAIIVFQAMGRPQEAMPYTMNIYIESAGMILCFVSLGKYLEAKANAKTTSSIASLMALVPDTAWKIVDQEEVEVQTESLQAGDEVLVKPGSSIPTDGILLSALASVNESAISGESRPVEKEVGEKIVGGTINVGSAFRYRVTEIGKDSTMGKIISLVEEASTSKAPLSRLADKVSSVFCPAVMLLSLVVFIVWEILTGLGLAGNSFPDTSLALQLAVSVLVVSCPCALGLATPVAVMVGSGKGAEQGILIKSAEAFERMGKVDVVLFDKTGTLTEGNMSLVDSYEIEGFEGSPLLIAASMERKSEHPIAKAFLSSVEEKGLETLSLEEVVSLPGQGLASGDYLVGNLSLFKENGVDSSKVMPFFERQSAMGRTVVLFGNKKEAIAAFSFADTLKATSHSCIETLQNMGKHVAIVTGDNHLVAQEIAANLGVDSCYDEVMPSEKEMIVAKLQSEGKTVAFVGDGVNDAPALTRADVGLALGAGTDVALDSADIVLVKSEPQDVVEAVRLSKAVVRNIKENLLWAFFYNLLLIPLAAGALYAVKVPPNWFTGDRDHLVLTPMIGSMAMSLSSITVVLNALRLKRFRRKG